MPTSGCFLANLPVLTCQVTACALVLIPSSLIVCSTAAGITAKGQSRRPSAANARANSSLRNTSRPSLTIARLDETLVSAILATDNWRGARFVRLRTLAQYLDGEPDADATRHWPADVYRVERREKETKTEIVFQLATPLDFDNKQLPGRQVLRDVCGWQYRRWDASAGKFTYAHAEVACPYRGSNYFDAEDKATGKSGDACSQRLSGCLARYPDRVVPFGGFIGVGRFRRT